jgi:hypothetical protein
MPGRGRQLHMKPFFKQQRIINAAYRGLWTSSALPGSLEAIRRAYLSGLPALVEENEECSFAQALQLAWNAVVNPFRQPVYVTVSDLPSLPFARVDSGASEVFAVIRGESTCVWAVWRRCGGAWEPAGAYLPATVAVESLYTVAFDSITDPVVMYEAPDVVSMFGERSRIGELNDVQLRQAVSAYAGPDATIVRVSDMFEIEQQISVAAA